MKLAYITTLYRAKLIAKTYDGWLQSNKKVLDIGCGNGVITKELEKIFKLKISGCDTEQYLLYDVAFKKVNHSDKLPYKNKSFDFALLNDVLHHMEYDIQKKIIIDALRVADVVLIFELKPTFTGKLFDFILNKIHYMQMHLPFTFRTEKAWKKLLNEQNITYTTKQIPTPIWYPFTHVSFALKKNKKAL